MSDIEIVPYEGHDSERLFYRRLVPPSPKAGVLLVHGYSGHSGRYEHIMEALARQGFASFCPDHRGHGLSARLLGFVERMEDIVEDLAHLKGEIAPVLGERPSFIMGHSMGGLLSVLVLGKGLHNHRGAVLSAPAVMMPPTVPWAMKKLAHVLSRSVPTLGVRGYFDPAKAARSELNQRSMLDDPLFYKGRVRARTAAEILKAVDASHASLDALDIPLMIVHGTEDQVIPPEASQLLYDRSPSADKTLRTFDGSYHQLLSDPEWEVVLGEIVDWMVARI